MKKQFPLLFILVSTIIGISACTKIVTTDIGSGLLPPIDGINTKEMYLDVVTKNIKDTINKVSITSLNTLGYVNDPLFGKTSASINIELKPVFPFTLPADKAHLRIDSVVLVLGYNSTWGDTLTPLGLKVFEIKNSDPATDVLRDDSAYDTNYDPLINRDLTENGSASIDITKLNDSTHPFQEAAINQLRIRLNSSYGTELLQNYDTSATGAYHNDSLFERFFKGYKISPVEGNGKALLRINLLDTNTKLAIYFKYDSANIAGKEDTTVRYFRPNSFTSGSSNYVKRDRTGTRIPDFLPTNPNLNDSLLFIDANPGIYTSISIPGLSDLSNRIIHRAELLAEQVPGDAVNDGLFTAPNLFLAPYTADSTPRFILPNEVIISNGYIVNHLDLGSIPFTGKDSATQQLIYKYNFNMSRYVQGIITRKETNYSLILFAPSNDGVYVSELSTLQVSTGTSSGNLNAPATGRVRLGGGNHTTHKMRLHIVYSDLR